MSYEGNFFNWKTIAGGAGIALALTVLLVWWSKAREEKELYASFSEHLTSPAEAEYRDKGLLTRLAIARATAPVVAELERTPWRLSIDELRAREGAEPEFSYSLGLATGSVQGCTFSTPPAIEGRCTAGSYVDRMQGSRTRDLDVGFRVDLGEDPYVETLKPTLLSVGRAGNVAVRGTVRLDDSAAEVRDGRILIPDPLRPDTQLDEVETGDFTIGETPILVSTESWTFDTTYPMPPLLAPMFDHASSLTVARLEGAVRVDLRHENPGYRAEGKLEILNHELAHAAVEYYPRQHASLAVHHLTFPVPFPGVCFNVHQALAEMDFVDNRLRVGGTLVMESAESFSCRLRGTEMGYFTRGALTAMFNAARETLDLPETVLARGHLVVDLDDLILCGDASVNGMSLVHAAYDARREYLAVWAPKRFGTSNVGLDGIISSTFRVGTAFALSEWDFPSSTEWRCWDGDNGPKTDMFASILPQTSPLAHH